MKKLLTLILAALMLCAAALAEPVSYKNNFDSAVDIVNTANYAASQVDENFAFTCIGDEQDGSIAFMDDSGNNMCRVNYGSMEYGADEIIFATCNKEDIGTCLTMYYYLISGFFGDQPEVSDWFYGALQQVHADSARTGYASVKYELDGCTLYIDHEQFNDSDVHYFCLDSDYTLLFR